jgi:hypothetical protein
MLSTPYPITPAVCRCCHSRYLRTARRFIVEALTGACRPPTPWCGWPAAPATARRVHTCQTCVVLGASTCPSVSLRHVVAWSITTSTLLWDFDVGKACSTRKRAWRVGSLAKRPNDPALLLVRALSRFVSRSMQSPIPHMQCPPSSEPKSVGLCVCTRALHETCCPLGMVGGVGVGVQAAMHRTSQQRVGTLGSVGS